MSPILITGATGHVGMHLIHLLHEKGYAVRALVRDHARAANLPHEVEVVVGDLAHPKLKESCAIQLALDAAPASILMILQLLRQSR